MADPEISRRCRFCGASIRERGLFCPQCGKPSTDSSADAAAGDPSLKTEEVFDAPETVSLDFPSLPTADLPNHTAANAETLPLQPFTKQSDVVRQQAYAAAASSAPAATTRLSETDLQQAATVSSRAHDAAADVKKGFDRVREISTVVLDEATYDPSARFVLVAAVLFVLFLVILILSEMMR
jgi:hypothetical protein